MRGEYRRKCDTKEERNKNEKKTRKRSKIAAAVDDNYNNYINK